MSRTRDTCNVRPTTCDLSILIVNWNTRDLLADCLRSIADCGIVLASAMAPSAPIYQSTNLPITEVIVVDNASTDGSAAMVRERFPWVRLIESGENLGFAAGNNLALKQAEGEYLLLLNPDTVVPEGALIRLVQIMRACPQLGALSPQLLNMDRTLQSSWGYFPALSTELPIIRQFVQQRAGARKAVVDCQCGEQVLSVDWAKGACLMIRRKALEQVGLLDEDYWLYTEEVDWCYRARQLGWEIGVAPRVTIIHVEQAASRQRLAHSLIQYSRSRTHFLRKHRSVLAARVLWVIYAAKSGVWALWPGRSPLGRSPNDLDLESVRSAYMALLKASLKQCTHIS